MLSNHQNEGAAQAGLSGQIVLLITQDKAHQMLLVLCNELPNKVHQVQYTKCWTACNPSNVGHSLVQMHKLYQQERVDDILDAADVTSGYACNWDWSRLHSVLQESDLEDARSVGASKLYELPVSMCGCSCLLPEEACCSSSCRNTLIYDTS